MTTKIESPALAAILVRTARDLGRTADALDAKRRLKKREHLRIEYALVAQAFREAERILLSYIAPRK